MEFFYYTDEIVLNEDIENNGTEFNDFNEFCENVKRVLIQNGINLNETTMFYKRNKERKSVLGIKIGEGDKCDLTNYIVFDAMSNKLGVSSLVYCDIDAHADHTIAQEASPLLNPLFPVVNDFFNATENKIHRFIIDQESFDVMKTISLEEKKDEHVGLLRRLFGKK